MELDPALLVRHVDFARRLALGLVGDPHLADDLAQEALRRTLEHPPRDPRGLRGYLATIVRRAAFTGQRAAAHRREREERAARPDLETSTTDLVEAMDLHQSIVRELVTLDEPVRTALLQRFFEDLPPREIARRAGVPVETIRTRIKRGLAALRQRLDTEHGERGAWAGLLLPLARPLAPLAGALPLASGAGSAWIPAAALLALGTAALTVALWEREPGSRSVLEALAEGPVPESISAPEPGPDGPGAGAGRVAAGVPASTARVEAPDPAPAGRLVVREPGGEARPAESGTFRAAFLDGAREELPVRVEQGRFRLEASAPRPFRVAALTLADRVAFPDLDRLVVGGEGGLVIEATFAPPAYLRVVDSLTGADLQDVEVVRGVPRYRDDVHPGRWTGDVLWKRHAASPIELEPTRAEEHYWVRAPGRVWGFATVDHRTGGERRVALAPDGADLLLELLNHEPDLDLFVRLFPAGSEGVIGDVVSVRPGSGTVHLRGLPPGSYQVRAELGFWQYRPSRLVTLELELLPGTREHRSLDLFEKGVVPPSVPLAGTIHLPAGFPGEPHPWLRPLEHGAWRKGDIRRGDELGLERRSPTLFSFAVGEVTPGRYVLIDAELQFWQVLDVPEPGLRDARVEYPPVAEVHVRLVDGATGADVPGSSLAWSRREPEGSYSWTLASVEPVPGEPRFAFHAPLGPIRVLAERDGFADASGRIEVVAGRNELVLETRPTPGLWIELLDGESRVALDWGIPVTVRPLVGEGTARRTLVERGRALISASEPGLFQVELGPLDGFEPVPPFGVEIVAGDPGEHVVRLRRR